MKTVFTITGPSGSGKSTLERKLVEVGMARVKSTTTRPIRSGEVDGVDYDFIDADMFQHIIDLGEFVDHKVFKGNGQSYGATLGEFERCFEKGSAAVLVVEPGGAQTIKEYGHEKGWRVISVFVSGDAKTLVQRFLLRDEIRPVDSAEAAERLVHLMQQEMAWIDLDSPGWDIVVERFDALNDVAVVEFLNSMVVTEERLLANETFYGIPVK